MEMAVIASWWNGGMKFKFLIFGQTVIRTTNWRHQMNEWLSHTSNSSTSNKQQSNKQTNQPPTIAQETIMPFWGGSNDSNKSSAPKDFSSSDESFAASSMSSPAGTSSVSDFQQFSVNLQQQVLVQTIITNLSDTAFEKCIVSKPGESLAGKEAACIHATVNKMMDTNEFMMGRLAKKQQAAQAGQGF